MPVARLQRRTLTWGVGRRWCAQINASESVPHPSHAPTITLTHYPYALSPSLPPLPTAWWVVPLKDFIAGTVGGFAGKIIEYPFDTIKVQMQASGDSSRGPLSCFREVLRKDGVKGLYNVRWERELDDE